MNQMSHWSSKMLWIIYLALLAVLLPHTAWAFARFESPAAGWLGVSWGIITAWAAAFAALTRKLAGRIATTPRYTAGRVLLRCVSYQYLNAYAAGLFVALGVSTLANFAHAVEYGREFAIFGRYSIPLFFIPSRSVASCRLCRFSLPGSWAIPPPLKPHQALSQPRRSRASKSFGLTWMRRTCGSPMPNPERLRPNSASLRPEISLPDCSLRKSVSASLLRPNGGPNSRLHLSLLSPVPLLGMSEVLKDGDGQS